MRKLVIAMLVIVTIIAIGVIAYNRHTIMSYTLLSDNSEVYKDYWVTEEGKAEKLRREQFCHEVVDTYLKMFDASLVGEVIHGFTAEKNGADTCYFTMKQVNSVMPEPRFFHVLLTAREYDHKILHEIINRTP